MTPIDRRGFLAGLATSGTLLLTGCGSEDPPTYGNVLRMGDRFTYSAQRLLLPRASLAREYDRRDISSTVAIGNTDPGNDHLEGFDPVWGRKWAEQAVDDFRDWRLEVAGAVDRPGLYSLEDLRRLPPRTQITKHMCEEGWSAISEWTGVPLRAVLDHAGTRTSARFVNFFSFDTNPDSIDMIDALHPQTILAYGMNGQALPHPHGAPIRLRVERQLGYKNVKFIRRIEVTEHFVDPGATGLIQSGWSWYTGI